MDNRYGDPEGLVERLRKWRARLTSDKSLPWIGMGFIADLDTAIAMLGSDHIYVSSVEDWQALARTPPPAIEVSDLLS